MLLKRELMRIPILGTAMRMAKFVPVERGSRPDAAAASVAAAAEALKVRAEYSDLSGGNAVCWMGG